MRISFVILLSVLLLSGCDFFDDDDDAPPPTPSSTSIVNLSPPPSPVEEGHVVHLHADITGEDAIEWAQVAGTPVVNLADQTTSNPVFTAPTVTSRETLQFELRVTSAGTTSTFPLQLDVTPVSLAVDAGKDQLVNQGAQVSLHASATPSTGVTYTWSQLSGHPVTLSSTTVANPTFTASVPYVNPGSGTLGSFDGDLVFRVTLSQPATGGLTYDDVEVKVNPPVAPPVVAIPLSVSAGQDQVVSVSDDVYLHAVTSGGVSIGGASGAAGYTYLWTQTNTGIGPTATLNNTTSANPDFTPTDAGRYVFEVTATDDNSDTATDSVVIDVKDTLTVSLGPTGGLRAGAKLSLHPVVTGGTGNFSYQWATDKPVTYLSGSATEANPVVTYNPTVSEQVTFTLTVTDNGVSPPVSASASKATAFLVPLRVSSVDAGVDKIVKPGDRVSLHALATPRTGVSYQWQGPNGVSLSNANLPNAVFTAPTAEGDYVFTVTATTKANSVTDTVTISVQQPVTSNAGTDKTVTEGDTIHLHGAGEHGSGSYSYQWTVDSPVGAGGSFDDATNPNAKFNPSQAGVVYELLLAVTDTGTNTTLTDTVQITVLENLSVDAGQDRTVAPSHMVTLHATANKPNASFTWNEKAPITGIPITPENPPADGSNASFTAPVTERGYDFEVTAQKPLAKTARDGVTITVQTPVSTNAGSDQTVVKGHLVHLHGSAAHGTGTYAYQWSEIKKPNGSTATLNNAATDNPDFTPDKAGVYEFDLQVTDSSAPPQIVHDTVTITVVEDLVANAGPDQTTEAGKRLLLRASASGGSGNFSIKWTLPPGLTPLDGTTVNSPHLHVTANPTATQSYTVQLTATSIDDPAIQAQDSVDLTFTVAAAPVDPTKPPCTLSPEKCANVVKGAPTGQRAVFAGTGTVKFPTGDYEPLPDLSKLERGRDCAVSTGRNAPTNATFSAFRCGTGGPGEDLSSICERLVKFNPLEPCAPGELPYTRVINHDTGAREFETGCMSRQQCTQAVPGLQPRAATDQNKALNDKCLIDDPKFVKTENFECTFCCVGDACNYQSAGCFVQPGTLWTVP